MSDLERALAALTPGDISDLGGLASEYPAVYKMHAVYHAAKAAVALPGWPEATPERVEELARALYGLADYSEPWPSSSAEEAEFWRRDARAILVALAERSE